MPVDFATYFLSFSTTLVANRQATTITYQMQPVLNSYFNPKMSMIEAIEMQVEL